MKERVKDVLLLHFKKYRERRTGHLVKWDLVRRKQASLQ